MSQTFRRAARIDSNQNAIVEALEQIPGVSVAVGHDDIFVGYRNRNFWFELKSSNKKKMRPSQKKLFARWTGHYQVVSSLDEILLAIGVTSLVRNQCDGCQQDAPLRDGLHVDKDGHAFMACQKHKYEKHNE